MLLCRHTKYIDQISNNFSLPLLLMKEKYKTVANVDAISRKSGDWRNVKYGKRPRDTPTCLQNCLFLLSFFFSGSDGRQSSEAFGHGQHLCVENHLAVCSSGHCQRYAGPQMCFCTSPTGICMITMIGPVWPLRVHSFGVTVFERGIA